MAIYDKEQGLQSILDASLGDFKNFGFSLGGDGDHLLYLSHNGKRIATFSQSGATIPAVHNQCILHLKELVDARLTGEGEKS